MSDTPEVKDLAKSRSISFKPSRWSNVTAIAKAHFNDTPSDYINALVAADLFADASGVVHSRLARGGNALSIDENAFSERVATALKGGDVREVLGEVVEQAMEARGLVPRKGRARSTSRAKR